MKTRPSAIAGEDEADRVLSIEAAASKDEPVGDEESTAGAVTRPVGASGSSDESYREGDGSGADRRRTLPIGKMMASAWAKPAAWLELGRRLGLS